MRNSVHNDDLAKDMAKGENIKEDARRQGKKPPKKISEKYLYNSGLAYLQRFTSSVPNFRRIMMKKIDKSCKHHTDQDKDACVVHLDAVVETLQRQGWLNDDAYVQGMVNSLRRRGLSSRAIQAKLQQKGLTNDKIMAALAVYDGEDNTAQAELMAAVQFMRRKRLGVFAKERSEKHIASLARAGFGFGIAQKALEMSLEEAEEILNSRAY